MGNFVWKPSEIIWLKKNYSKLGAKQCALMLDRPVRGIYIKANRLGLKDNRKAWSDDEIVILKNNYKKGVLYCSKILGRTKCAVMLKAKKYNLKVDPEIKKLNYKEASKKKWKQTNIKDKLKKGRIEYLKNKLIEDRGKTKTSQNGYILIKDHLHPNRNGGNYVAEHIKVVSEDIGRPLKKEEIVHHIDMDKQNNNISNLYLCKDKSEHGLCHGTMNKIIKQLIKKNIVRFENGRYKISKV